MARYFAHAPSAPKVFIDHAVVGHADTGQVRCI